MHASAAVAAPDPPGHPLAIELSPPVARPDVEPRRRRRTRAPEVAIAGVILAAAAALRLVALGAEGFGNTYYAAAVWSMLQNWKAFFFVAFDAPGYISVDKPPVGLWVQALSARLFGFNGVALLAPQALAGVASVALVGWLGCRAFGPLAGLVAAAALAVTPISVVTDRNNTMDAQLVLVLVLAAAAATFAAERGHLRPLLLSAGLVGLGFNVKMLQAYPVVPGFALAYLALAPVPWRRRLLHVVAFSLVLLVVSLSWSVVVDLTPVALRPYVGSSGSNSAISLALGYNGLSRITLAVAQRLPLLHVLGASFDLDVAPAFAPGIGEPGLGRLLQPSLAGQASWLLPLALVGLAAGVLRARRRPERVALVIWGGWLLSWGAIFSFGRFFHIYYLIMLGPAVAILAGAGIGLLWRAYRRRHAWAWLVLPAVLLGSVLLETRFLGVAPGLGLAPGWQARLEPMLLSVAGLAAVALVLQRRPTLAARVALGAAVAAVLVAPTLWSVTSVQTGDGGAWLPSAGPASSAFGAGPGGAPFSSPQGIGLPSSPPPPKIGGGVLSWGVGGGPRSGRGVGFGFGPGSGAQAMTFAGSNWDQLDPNLVSFLQAEQGTTTYLVATPTSSYASIFILATHQPALALGGYQGWDQVISPTQLAQLVSTNVVRFFYLPAAAGAGFSRGPATPGAQDATADLTAWVRATCSVVPAFSSGAQQLYDCAAAG